MLRTSIGGSKFGKLLVLSDEWVDSDHKKVLVRCDCNKEFAIRKSALIRGASKSCNQGTCRSTIKNETGKTFNYLTVIEIEEQRSNIEKTLYFKCQCTCGQFTIVGGTELRSGHTKSCGCKSRILSSQKNSKPFGESNLHQLYNNYKKSARERNMSFELSENEFRSFLDNNCHYCGRAPNSILSKNNMSGERSIKYNGIDRVDNNKGYVITNCITCCKICNFAKRSMNHSDFIDWLNDVTMFRKSLLEKKEQYTESMQ